MSFFGFIINDIRIEIIRTIMIFIFKRQFDETDNLPERFCVEEAAVA